MKRSIAPLFVLTGLVILGCGGSGGIATIVEDYAYYVSGSSNLVRRGDLTGNTNTLFTSGAGAIRSIRVSPDQSRIVFHDGNGITVQNKDGSGIVSIAGYQKADWNADGSRLYAITNDSKIVSMNPDGSGVSAVIFDGNFGGGIGSIDVSRDGAVIVMDYSPSGWYQIHTILVDGTGLSPLTATGVNSTEPRWSPDGSQIFYMRRMSGQDSDIYVMNDDGSSNAPIANSSDEEMWPVPRSGGSVLFSYGPSGGNLQIWSMNYDGTAKASFEVAAGVNLGSPEAE
ncbi:MAG: PD40 domain-containing protein [Fimbriimonadaceae bacterium]|nr:PD40 domain-containing protein [Fimbriimonadaceae bacterium]